MYDQILVPTDGSKPAAAAVEEGIELARQNDAAIHALYVVEPIPLGQFSAGSGPASSEWGDVVEEQRTEGDAATTDVADRASEYDLVVVQAIEHGKPHVQILEYVDEHDIDAIVMGTHGRAGVDRLVLGSVTEKVVRKSEVPVLTVRE
ncbi:universal stress protein [Natronorubrum texcoconense]|uniref:Nucleotide-binding universal stress protein, UspA family n=1 Tax=Natronorubrum texcoconense TaxID=1095776 RepID=A0A1G8TRM4_9EURY|nr:universal stress protein [Natronorubrum texcoconense]SDJ43595.1 Nucleotide-binding universal stress protein, UspA family [Natronorubrum texcoconense]